MTSCKHSHPCFDTPSDRDISVWRYMDLWKFVSLLSTSQLWMTRLDLLRDGDPFEGSVPLGFLEDQERRLNALRHAAKANGEDLPEEDEASRERARDYWVRLLEQYATRSYVTCWTHGPHESNALWKIYCDGVGGVAVRSTFAKLDSALPDGYYVGLVRYIDYTTDTLRRFTTIEPAANKSRVFEYEREIRIVHPFMDDSPEPLKPNMTLRLDLSSVIVEVRISPYSPGGYLECVKALVERFGYTFPVGRSSMSAAPLR